MVLKGVLLAILCSFTSFCIHLIISLLRGGRQRGEPVIFELMCQTKLLLAIWSVSFLIYAGLFFLLPDKINILVLRFNAAAGITGFIYGIILYLILSFLYLTIYYFLERSVSATILEIIENAPEKKLTLEEIKKVYNIEKKYQSELKGMAEGRFVVKELNYYKNSLKGSLYARGAMLMKKLLKLGPGG